MIYLKKLTDHDGVDVYEMLQDIPVEENGFTNSYNGKTYEEFCRRLRVAEALFREKEVIDDWKSPETLYWLYDGDYPVGFGKIRHVITDALKPPEETSDTRYGQRSAQRVTETKL